MAPSNTGWKTGEQLEFLLANEPSYKRCQANKTLDLFWQRVFDSWYTQWPIVPTATLTRAHGFLEATKMAKKSRDKVCDPFRAAPS